MYVNIEIIEVIVGTFWGSLYFTFFFSFFFTFVPNLRFATEILLFVKEPAEPWQAGVT